MKKLLKPTPGNKLEFPLQFYSCMPSVEIVYRERIVKVKEQGTLFPIHKRNALFRKRNRWPEVAGTPEEDNYNG